MIIRQKLEAGSVSIGSWMQIPSADVAEIMGKAGFDWIVVDLEHGAFSRHTLPDILRALELGGTIPLARVAQPRQKDIKSALDAGAKGIILPMIESAQQLEEAISWACYPPKGTRGVGYCRANLYGKEFDPYVAGPANEILIVAQIENAAALQDLNAILAVKPLDAIIVGPYDLSASMNLTAQFEHPKFEEAMRDIHGKAKNASVPMGLHIVQPDREVLNEKIEAGYQFIAYGTDAVFLWQGAEFPLGKSGKRSV